MLTNKLQNPSREPGYDGAGPQHRAQRKVIDVSEINYHDLRENTSRVVTPYKWPAWEVYLESAGLYEQYRDVVDGIRNGFNIHFPPITRSQLPHNGGSIRKFREHFNNIVANELAKGRYTGPFTQAEIEDRIGPCQSSPLTIIPKPHRPGKFRVIQNFSYPEVPSPQFPNESINSASSTLDLPCTWGTFQVTCLLISGLPPGSQAAVRDVSEAYRTVPLHPSQWPAAVVRADSDAFYIDSVAAFGARASGAVFGRLADCEGDIFRANGLGPLVKWVDDNLFLRVLRTELEGYNARRKEWQDIVELQGRHQSGARIWFGNGIKPDDSGFEAVEDFHFPILDLSTESPRSPEDARYSYSFEDIDEISEALGVPWELSKDSPFASTATYIGLFWDLEAKTVSLTVEKRQDYLANILEWEQNEYHAIEEVQQVYGRLMHVTHVLPSGRAYLLHFEKLLGDFAREPNTRMRTDARVAEEVAWWRDMLRYSALERKIPGTVEPVDISAYSDASSDVGIGIIIGDWWRAWRLLPDWKTHGGVVRDISWAEAIGFELLVDAVLDLVPYGQHVKLYGDNNGVVQGWWNGRSRNIQVNEVFKCIHNKLEAAGVWGTIHTAYVRSAENPADGLSRGVYPHSRSRLLPPMSIPTRAQGLLVDALAPLTLDESLARDRIVAPKPARRDRFTAREPPLRSRLTYSV